MALGERIKKYRFEKGYTQQQLADMLSVSVMTIRRFESNSREPKMDMINRIATALETPMIKLMFDSDVLETPVKDIKDMTNLESAWYETRLHEKEQFEKYQAIVDSTNSLYAENPAFIVAFFNCLNKKGRIEAVRRIYEMTKLPEYTTPDEE